VLINLERVGGLGSRADDVLVLGDCDEGIRKLASALGWLEELEALWEETNPEKGKPAEKAPAKSQDEILEDEVEKLMKDIDASLKLTNDHSAFVNDQLSKDKRRHISEEKDIDPSDSSEASVEKLENGTDHGNKKNGGVNGFEGDAEGQQPKEVPSHI